MGIHEVKKGPVVYMAGEGAPSLQRRVRAWCDYHDVHELNGAYFQVRPLPLREEEVVSDIISNLKLMYAAEQGAGDAARVNTRLIVVDTLSQFFGGGDENGPDMALFVSNLRRLSQDYETAILIVHHGNATNERERGHSSLRCNVDVGFQCIPINGDKGQIEGLRLKNDKQRDTGKNDALILKLQPTTYGKGEEDNSLVVVPTMKAPPRSLPTVTGMRMTVLTAMLNTEDQRAERCHHKTLADYIGKSVGTLHEHLDGLEALKLVKKGRPYSSLTTTGRLVLEKAGITREEEEADE